MTLKSDAKLKEKLTCGFEYDVRNLVSFHPTTQMWKFIFDGLMDSFCPRYRRFELQKHRGVIFHDSKQWCKIWINSDFAVSKMAWATGWTSIRVLKSLKKYIMMGSFYPKHTMFQLENFIGILCHDTKGWCKI